MEPTDLLRALADPETVLGWWLRSFLLTLAVEVPVYVLVTQRWVRPSRAGGVGALASLVTHPALWFLWPRVVHSSYAAYIVSGELLVACIEATLFYALARPGGWSRAAAASLLANGASYLVGSLLPRGVLLAA